MLRAGTAQGPQVIYPCETGYFVVFSSQDSVFAGDFQTTDEFEAVTKALEICGDDWEGLVSIEDNTKWEEECEPVLCFEFMPQEGVVGKGELEDSLNSPLYHSIINYGIMNSFLPKIGEDFSTQY